MATKNIESTTLFDLLPTEIIFILFDYLSKNDIIYTFFFFNQRFHNLILQNEHYFNYLELPTTNLNTWKKILSIIGSQMKSLNIIYLSLPLTYFPNLKSLIISSPYVFPDNEMKSIVENNLFQNLDSFKIKETEAHFNEHYTSEIAYKIVKKVFHPESSLKIFECSTSALLFAFPHALYFRTNFNLYSLTIKLNDFGDIFLLIEFTPNLKYLNVQSELCSTNQLPINKVDIKLEQLYLIVKTCHTRGIDSDQLINRIKQFSSSLSCLSLNLVDLPIENVDEFPFNSKRLQKFLESMTELKQFHLYAKLSKYQINNDIILSEFKNEFWFDHNLSFGMHDKYFYTLPFHFDHLYKCFKGFNDIKSNNLEILINNSRIWYNVKSIELCVPCHYDINFVKELKIKMPKLTSIKFVELCRDYSRDAADFHIITDEREKIDVTLDNVTSIEFIHGSIENQKDWIIYSLPNLRHLVLYFTTLRSIDRELAQILNKRIQRLDIYSYYEFEALTEITYVYFSNVQHINIDLPCGLEELQLYADTQRKIRENASTFRYEWNYEKVPSERV